MGGSSGTRARSSTPSLQYPKLPLEVWGPAGRASQGAASSPGTGVGLGIEAPSPVAFLCDGWSLRSDTKHSVLCKSPSPRATVCGDQATPPCPKHPRAPQEAQERWPPLLARPHPQWPVEGPGSATPPAPVLGEPDTWAPVHTSRSEVRNPLFSGNAGGTST